MSEKNYCNDRGFCTAESDTDIGRCKFSKMNRFGCEFDKEGDHEIATHQDFWCTCEAALKEAGADND